MREHVAGFLCKDDLVSKGVSFVMQLAALDWDGSRLAGYIANFSILYMFATQYEAQMS